MLDRLEQMLGNMTKRVNTDFVTKDAINKQLHAQNDKMTLDYVLKFEYRENAGKVADKMDQLIEDTRSCKKALQNHTKHITKLKKEQENFATKVELRTLADHTKMFALNTELVDLYNKVVPPTKLMQEVGDQMTKQVE